jgi:hypothetical protein
MIEQTASLTAAETIARLRVSRGGLNGPAAVVLSAMTFHVAIAWISALRSATLWDSCGGGTARTNPSFPHADTPAHTAIAPTRCVALVLMDALIPASP